MSERIQAMDGMSPELRVIEERTLERMRQILQADPKAEKELPLILHTRAQREAMADAARLIKRGLKAIARKEWEEGQTLESWTHEAEDWLAVYRLEKQIAAKLRKGVE